MKATLTPAPVEPKPEGSVTLTMTETEAKAVALFLGKHAYDQVAQWLSAAEYSYGDRPTVDTLYNATANVYFAISDALDFV